MKRGISCAVTALAALLIVQGCGGSSTGARGATNAISRSLQTVTFESQLVTIQEVAGAAAGGTGKVGSQLVFTGMLFRPGGTLAIGRSQGACTRTAPGTGIVFQCNLTFLLPNGDIFGQAVADRGGPPFGSVSGGTGVYQNMTGTFRYAATGHPRIRLILLLRS